jgi:lysozyme family protein
MLANRQRSLNWAYEEEGGYVERLSEPGGAGNLGISFKVFQAWEKLNGNPKASFADLKAMGKDIASRIYETEWMNPLRFDELASGTDYALFDAAVNLGVTGAIRMLQEKVLFWPPGEITGRMDVMTMAAIAALLKTRDVAVMITNAWLLEKKASPEWPEFGKGWAARAARVRGRLLVMML